MNDKQLSTLEAYAGLVNDDLHESSVGVDPRPDGHVVIIYKVDRLEEMDKQIVEKTDYSLGYMTASIFHFYDYENARAFLTLVDTYALDCQKVVDFYLSIHNEAWSNAISTFLGEASYGEHGPKLPDEVGEMPDWADLKAFKYADVITTASEGYNCCSLKSAIHKPDDTSLLFWMGNDDGEQEVEMKWALEDIGPLEEAVALNTVCHNDSPYAYVQTHVVGACFLLATPENLEFFRDAVNTNAFDRYYGDERAAAIETWLNQAEFELENWNYHEDELEEYQEQIDKFRTEFLGGE